MKEFILKLKQKYSNIPSDKRDHFYLCLYLSTVLGVLTNWFIGAGVTLAVGAIKEAFDKYTKTGTCEVDDFFADVYGTIAGSITALILNLI